MSEYKMHYSRRDLRERAFQALVGLDFQGDLLEQTYFALTYDCVLDDEEQLDIPAFLLQLVRGVKDEQENLDQELSTKLKKGWRLDRLSVIDRNLLRLGLYEITRYEETPDRVAINEVIELAKRYSDDEGPKFINGILTQFVKED